MDPDRSTPQTGPETGGLIVAMDVDADDVEPDPLRRVLSDVVEQLGLRRADVNFVLIDDERMADLHERFSGIAGTTDVLTFDLLDEPAPSPPNPNDLPREVEGEVYICVDEARRRASQMRHPVQHEVLLYAVHGLLHLMGYDDHEDEAYQQMHAKEDQLLEAVGIGAVFHRDGDSDP